MEKLIVNIRPMNIIEFDKYIEEVDNKIPTTSKELTREDIKAIGHWKRMAAKWVLANIYPDVKPENLYPMELFRIYDLTMAANKTVRDEEIKNFGPSSNGSAEIAGTNTVKPVQEKALKREN